jgi:hypothetical protein
VFLSWFFSIFPRELAHSWRLVRRDLMLWVAMATLLSLATIGIAQQQPGTPDGAPTAPDAFIALVGIVGMLVMATLPPVLFLAAAARETLDWGDVGRRIAGRVLPLLAYFLLAALLSWAAASTVLLVTASLLKGTPVAPAVSGTLASIILVSILCAFAFLPFLILLSDREKTPEDLWSTPRLPLLGRLLWPMIASARMTDGLRWRIAPYVVLNFVAPRLAPLAPVDFLLPALVAALLVSLVGLAVQFDYWLLVCERRGMFDLGLEWPERGFGKR